MKNQVVKVLGTGVLSVLMGCASSLKPATLASNSTTDEIAAQNAMMDQAYTNQVDVLAPDRFEEAMDYLEAAKKSNKDGTPAHEVLEAIAYSRSYLNKANTEANATKSQTSQIIVTRQMALTAGARKYPRRLNKIDEKLMDFTDEKTIAITMKQRDALQDEYAALELHCIMQSNLGKAKNILKDAKERGAEKITPTVYAEALEKFTIAERTIQNDRHSNAKIGTVSAEATASAKRVMKLLDSEKISRNMTPEERALNLEKNAKVLTNTRNAKAAVVAASLEKDEVINEKDEVINEKNDELSAQGEVLAVSRDQNEVFKARALDEAAVKDAAARFDSSEADVYRQDGLLIIRLKSMNFASSRSDLPASSMAVLAKVKEVIKGFGAGRVTVEGHTDGMGEAKVNQKLSELRAQSVSQYLTADETLAANQISSVGYGYTKPLGTNKTAEGRSQNRRVDILINPDQAI